MRSLDQLRSSQESDGGPLKQDGKKRFLIIGETGAGKTTFLNLLEKRLLCRNGVGPDGIEEDKKYSSAIGFGEAANKKEGESLTQDVTSYADTWSPDIEWLDSPGIGDTRGVKFDLQHLEKIINALGNLDYLSGIILMMNGDRARLDTRTVAILGHLFQYIPLSFIPNLFLVCTHVDEEEVKPFYEMMKGANLDMFFASNKFHLQNPIGKIFKAPFNSFSTKNQTRFVDDLKEVNSILDGLFKTLSEAEAQPVSEFIEINRLQHSYQTLIKGILDKAKEISKVQRDLTSALKDCDEKQTLFGCNDFLRAKFVEVTEMKIDPGTHNTVCNAPGCTSVCHVGCHVAGFISKCHVNLNGFCSVCRHSIQLHTHTGVNWEKVKKRQGDEVDVEAKSRAQTALSTARTVKQCFEAMQAHLVVETRANQKDLMNCFAQMRGICLPLVYSQFLRSKLNLVLQEYTTERSDGVPCPPSAQVLRMLVADARMHGVDVSEITEVLHTSGFDFAGSDLKDAKLDEARPPGADLKAVERMEVAWLVEKVRPRMPALVMRLSAREQEARNSPPCEEASESAPLEQSPCTAAAPIVETRQMPPTEMKAFIEHTLRQMLSLGKPDEVHECLQRIQTLELESTPPAYLPTRPSSPPEEVQSCARAEGCAETVLDSPTPPPLPPAATPAADVKLTSLPFLVSPPLHLKLAAASLLGTSLLGDDMLRPWCVAIKLPAAKLDLIVAKLEAQDVTGVDSLMQLSEDDLVAILGPQLATVAVRNCLVLALKALQVEHALFMSMLSTDSTIPKEPSVVGAGA